MHCAGTSGEVYNVHTDKEVCKLLPLKLADSQQESFVQEEDFPPLTIVNIVTVEGLLAWFRQSSKRHIRLLALG